MKVFAASILFFAVLLAAPSSYALASGYKYLSYDGRRAIVLSEAENLAYFSDPSFKNNAEDLIGGPIRRCSNEQYKCFSLLNIVLSVPRRNNAVDTWSIGEASFQVKYRSEDTRTWIVKGHMQNGTHYVFRYRYGVGVDQISLDPDPETFRAETFFCLNKRCFLH